MNYWLLCLPRKDLEHCAKIGTFGLARKHILGQVSEGDPVVCCAGKGDWKILGFGTATSPYYMSDSSVFLKEGSFPDRFDFNAKLLSKEDEIDLMTIIDQLSFVSNLAFWAVYFRNGIVKLSESDYKLISGLVETCV